MDPLTQRRGLGASDANVTTLGFGGAAVGNLYRETSDEDAHATLSAAWDAGIRYFDTAPFYGYGLSERRLGEFLRSQPSGQWLLSTKVGRLLHAAEVVDEADGFVRPLPFTPVFDYSYAGVMRSFEDSVRRLGMDRIDVLLMHDLGRYTHGPRHEEMLAAALGGGIRAMQELKTSGAVRALGLGVNEISICEQVLEQQQLDCILLAGRYSLLEQSPLRGLFRTCEQRGVSIVIGGPYNSGILVTGSRAASPKFDYGDASADVLARVRRVEAVCERHGVALPAAALQFCLAHPAVASVIPGLASPAQVRDTLSYLRAEIPAAFWDELRSQGILAPDAPLPAP
ncbi:MAG: aldo/keto reductase [Pseudomonadota bacterium]|nr:aldo/keto reductase [Pseudomonadota bacterium]